MLILVLFRVKYDEIESVSTKYKNVFYHYYWSWFMFCIKK